MVEEGKETVVEATQDVKPFSEQKAKVEEIVDSIVAKKFTQAYDSKQGQKWANHVTEEIIKTVQEECGQDYKYLCTIIVLQKGEMGFHMSASCFWEQKHDGNYNKKYDKGDYWVIVNMLGITRN